MFLRDSLLDVGHVISGMTGLKEARSFVCIVRYAVSDLDAAQGNSQARFKFTLHKLVIT